MIRIIVNSIPVAQPRQRHAIRGTAGRQFISNYTPSSHPVTAFKSDCRAAAYNAYRGAPLDEPLRVDIVAVFPRPKGKMYKSKPMPREYKASKPDRDNIEKSVYDALNGLVWRDDALIVDGRTEKIIAAGDEQPHVEITINPLGWI